MIQSLNEKTNRQRAQVKKLMDLLVEYARYEGESKKPIQDLKAKLDSATIRQHAGSIGILAITAFTEIGLAPTPHQRQAMRVTLYKVTNFWPNKPTPRPNQKSINLSDLEKVVAEELGRAA